MTAKQPTGPQPEVIWIEKRIAELSRAINEYVQYADDNGAMINKMVAKWADELSRLMSDYNKISEVEK